MKSTLLLYFICFSSFLWGQINIKVSGNIFNSQADSVYIAQFFGTHYVTHASSKFKEDGTFEIDGSVPHPDYYVLRVGNQNINLILRDKCDIKVYGDGGNLTQFVNIVNSAESSAMYKYLQIVNAWKIKSDSATQLLKADATQGEEINKKMGAAYQKFQGEQKAFIARNANSAALYAAIGSIDPRNDFATYESVVKQLIKSFSQSPSIKNLEKNYLTMKQQMQANDKLATGKVAPDFEEALPDGTLMKLSDLRGNIVLLDFWASWCKPCRRENPNVVRVYEKYKDKGFTVMSVSLDKAKANWLAAIKQDNLTWPYHVSDLKFWSSKAAKLYGVSGIPFTVLIDKEGKIIRTRLRGIDLETELARILGE